MPKPNGTAQPLRPLRDIRDTGAGWVSEDELESLVDVAVEVRALLDIREGRTERWHDQADEVARKLRRFPR